MSSNKRRMWKFRVRYILDAIAENEAYIRNLTFADFCADSKTKKAVAWNLVTIGEAVRHIPSEVVEAFEKVPWAQMRGIRNHMVHGYDQVDDEIVWKVVTEELPEIVPLLEQVIDEAEEFGSTDKTAE